MSNFNSADIAAFKDVWVFCEQREGKLMPTDFELISKGRDLADELGVNLCGLLLGGEGIESAAKELGGYGADKVLVCESPLLAVRRSAIKPSRTSPIRFSSEQEMTAPVSSTTPTTRSIASFIW